MIVKFECERCGKRFDIDSWYVVKSGPQEIVVPYHDCPKDKLQYGPLTEEMIVDALYLASGSQCDGKFSMHNQARFVLRVIDDYLISDINPEFKGKWDTEKYRAHLLDLARQK